MPQTEQYRNQDGVKVPAFQWSGQERQDFPWWMKERSNHAVEKRRFGEDEREVLVVQSLDGEEIVERNDWVMETPRGEIKAVKADDFQNAFVPADAGENVQPQGNLGPESMADPSASHGSERIGAADNPEEARERTSTRARRKG
jgi:hypothetical protein